MMQRDQFLLTKLVEECAEVQQIALKIQQFGFSQIKPGQDKTNADRLTDELNDLFGILELLRRETLFNYIINTDAVKAKMDKVNKYYEYSTQLGLVEKL